MSVTTGIFPAMLVAKNLSTFDEMSIHINGYKTKYFNETSGCFFTVLVAKNRIFITEVRTLSSCVSGHKIRYFDEKSGYFPAELSSKNIRFFDETLGQFQLCQGQDKKICILMRRGDNFQSC